ncbi:MAG TPA: hypothetical protein VF165_13585 [Nocardioidaceae bacterium]
MELLLLAVPAAAALGGLMMHRRRQVVAWDRELDRAFGVGAGREIAAHRRL